MTATVNTAAQADEYPDIASWPKTVTGYMPQQGTGSGDCYCGGPVDGHTRYWNGKTIVVKGHCVDHLPARPVMYRAVKP